MPHQEGAPAHLPEGDARVELRQDRCLDRGETERVADARDLVLVLGVDPANLRVVQQAFGEGDLATPGCARGGEIR